MKVAFKILISSILLIIIYNCGGNTSKKNSGVTITDLGSKSTSPSISVSFTTASDNGDYDPEHVEAVWVSDSAGTVVKTLGRWAGDRVNSLKWKSLAGVDVDVKTGATEVCHGDVKLNNWGITNKSGIALKNGTYQLNIEFNENDNPTKHQMSSSIFVLKSDTAYITQKDETPKIFKIKLKYSK